MSHAIATLSFDHDFLYLIVLILLGHDVSLPQDIPHLEVKPGVLELKRSATGFSRTQLEVPVGKATTSVGFRCAS